MTIGFIDSEFLILQAFKDCVQAHPEFDYVLYLETREGRETGDAIAVGLDWLTQKDVDVLVTTGVLQNEVKEQAFSFIQLQNIPTVLVENVASYLEVRAKEFETAAAPKRIIHLTEHTEITDRKIAEILGGHFIKD